MSKPDNSGGQAFPYEFTACAPRGCCQRGMSLRAYIATHVLQGIVSDFTVRGLDVNAALHARTACVAADALLAELQKAEGGPE